MPPFNLTVPLITQPLRCAIYVRTNQHGQESRLIQQEHTCREYINRTAWVLDESHVFRDNAVNGLDTMNAPAFRQMQQAISDHDFDVLVVPQLDRISRDDSVVDRLFAEAKRNNIMIVSVTEDIAFDAAAI